MEYSEMACTGERPPPIGPAVEPQGAEAVEQLVAFPGRTP